MFMILGRHDMAFYWIFECSCAMQCEKVRLSTFENWQYSHVVDPRDFPDSKTWLAQRSNKRLTVGSNFIHWANVGAIKLLRTARRPIITGTYDSNLYTNIHLKIYYVYSIYVCVCICIHVHIYIYMYYNI